MFDKFEVLTRLKLSWGLSFLLFGVSDGHIFFDFSNYCPYLTPSKIPVEKMSWTLGKLQMSINPQWKEVEKILIHHFGAETQGFQGLVGQMTEGKPKSPKNHIFWKKFF